MNEINNINGLNIHAIIPARGGSKGIPRKNIINYKGKPLIAHTIELALKCPHINRVIVSTDDEEIAEISKQYGADVPFLRPKHLAGDYSRDIEFLLHYLNYLQTDLQKKVKYTENNKIKEDDNENLTLEIYKNIPDFIVQLRPTSPDRSLDELNDIIETYAKEDVFENYDSLRTVVPVKKSPFKMYLVETEDDFELESELLDQQEQQQEQSPPQILNKPKYLKPLFDSCYNQKEHLIVDYPYNAPRQILPQCYLHDGYVDIVKTLSLFKNKKSESGDKIYPYIRNITPKEIRDIDTPEDLI